MIHRFWSSDLGGGGHWNSMGNQGEKYTMSKENEGKYMKWQNMILICSELTYISYNCRKISYQ